MSSPELLTCDLAVVGAGGAGLAAALRGAAVGLRVVLTTRGRPGGRLLAADRIPVLDGLPVALRGDELVERALRQASRLGVVLACGEAVGLDADGDGPRRLLLGDGRRIHARAVIVATGADRAMAEVQGADRLLGSGVHTRAPDPGEPLARGGEVFVAGDPAAAARAALSLSAAAERVTVLTTQASALKGLSPELKKALRARGNIGALPRMVVVGAEGVDRLEVVVLRDARTGRLRARPASSLWLVGVERGRTAWLPGCPARDASGRLRTGRSPGALPSETTWRGVFAAGDARVGAPCGMAVTEDGIDVAEQACARLRLDLESAA